MDLEVAQKEGTEAFAENAAAVAAEALAREATSPAADRIAASGGATVWSDLFPAPHSIWAGTGDCVTVLAL